MEDTEPQNAAANGITPRRTNIKSVEILDTTLREGEQFSRAHFSFPQKIEIATALARFGVDYIEVGSPVSYPNALEELTTMVSQLKKEKFEQQGAGALSRQSGRCGYGARNRRLWYQPFHGYQ